MMRLSTALAALAVCVLAIHVSGAAALRASVSAMGSASTKQFVCTETFKAGLTSFFTQKDTKPAFAEDTAELCEMCAKVVRLAYLYSNDAATGKNWDRALENNACTYVSTARKGDCSAMTKGVIASQRTFFGGKKSKFTRKELKGTTEQLGLVVDKRAYLTCKQVGCCPILPKKSGAKVLKPCSKPGDRADVSADRDALTKDRFLLDKLREELFAQRRANNAFKAKLDLHEVDLKTRETKIAQERIFQHHPQRRDSSSSLLCRRSRIRNTGWAAA